MKHFLCKALALGTLLVALTLLSLPSAKAVYAAINPLSCTMGTSTSIYNPGITNKPQTSHIKVSEDYDYCTVAGLPSLTSGSVSFTSTQTVKCLAQVNTPTVGLVTYTWNTGQSSTVNFTATTVAYLVGGTVQVTSTGPVTAGFDAGAQAVRVKILPQLDPTQCSSEDGVTETRGFATMTFG